MILVLPIIGTKKFQVNKILADLSNTFHVSKLKSHVWGWGDENITDDMRKNMIISNPYTYISAFCVFQRKLENLKYP